MTQHYRTMRTPRHWYFALADWMLSHPGKPIKDASHKHGGPLYAVPETLRAIAQTDMFRAHLAQRQQDMRKNLDFGLVARDLDIADLCGELILDKMKQKRTQIPLKDLLAVQNSAMARLGFEPQHGPSVVVNAPVTQVSVTPSALAEAREMIRSVENRKREPLLLEHESASHTDEEVENVPLAAQ